MSCNKTSRACLRIISFCTYISMTVWINICLILYSFSLISCISAAIQKHDISMTWVCFMSLCKLLEFPPFLWRLKKCMLVCVCVNLFLLFQYTLDLFYFVYIYVSLNLRNLSLLALQLPPSLCFHFSIFLGLLLSR